MGTRSDSASGVPGLALLDADALEVVPEAVQEVLDAAERGIEPLHIRQATTDKFTDIG